MVVDVNCDYKKKMVKCVLIFEFVNYNKIMMALFTSIIQRQFSNVSIVKDLIKADKERHRSEIASKEHLKDAFQTTDIMNVYPIVKQLNPQASDAYRLFSWDQTHISKNSNLKTKMAVQRIGLQWTCQGSRQDP